MTPSRRPAHQFAEPVLSGGTVALGLVTLLVVPVPFIRSIGIGGMLVPLISVLASLTADVARAEENTAIKAAQIKRSLDTLDEMLRAIPGDRSLLDIHARSE